MGIDLFFLIISAYGLYFGYTNGVFRVLGTAFAIILGLLTAMYLTAPATEFVKNLFGAENSKLPLILFITLLVLIFLFGLLLFRMAKENIKNINVGKMEKTVGALIMAVFFSFLFAVILSFFTSSNAIGKESRESSFTYPILEKFSEGGIGLIRKIAPFVNTFVINLGNDGKVNPPPKEIENDEEIFPDEE